MSFSHASAIYTSELILPDQQKDGNSSPSHMHTTLNDGLRHTCVGCCRWASWRPFGIQVRLQKRRCAVKHSMLHEQACEAACRRIHIMHACHCQGTLVHYILQRRHSCSCSVSMLMHFKYLSISWCCGPCSYCIHTAWSIGLFCAHPCTSQSWLRCVLSAAQMW